MNDTIRPIGTIERIVEYLDGSKESTIINNTVLRRGKAALASCLANDLGGNFTFYINQMVFGTGGTSGGTPRFVNTDRNALFCGVPIASKNVISTVDGTQVILTSVLTFSDPVAVLNEMALVMYNEDFYSMCTFPDFTKTDAMQVTFNWRINFV
jgi:hypothetical protein